MNWKIDSKQLNPLKYHDKALHFLCGWIIAEVSFCFLYKIWHLSLLKTFGISLTITAIIAFVKEVYDQFSKGHSPDINDAIVTILGGALSLVLISLLVI